MILSIAKLAIAGELLRGWGAIPYGTSDALRALPDNICSAYRVGTSRTCDEHIGDTPIHVTYAVQRGDGRFDGVWIDEHGDDVCGKLFDHLQRIWGSGRGWKPTYKGDGYTISYWMWMETDRGSGTLVSWSMDHRPLASDSNCHVMASHTFM